MRLLIVLFLFSLPLSASNLDKIAHSQDWLKLIHYKHELFGYNSDADNDDFFFSRNGKDSPLDELKANIKEASNSNRYACEFPARYKFLVQKQLVKNKKASCPKLEAFYKKLKIKSISIVFATNYPQSPPSVFGHSFIKINSVKNLKDPLLDLGVNFSADVPPHEGTLAFAYRGLFGGYTGFYAIDYYSVKVKEYAELESRDLWEYEISFTDKQKEKFFDHLWELTFKSKFDYFFVDENCSYQLLWPLAYATGKMDFLTERDYTYWLPLDTVKIIKRELGGFKNIEFRPSQKRKLVSAVNELSSKEKTELEKLIQRRDFKNHKNIKLLDAYISYLEFITYRKEKKTILENETLFKLLRYRASLKKSKPKVIQKDFLSLDPLIGHEMSQLSFNYSKENNIDTYQLELSIFTHDYLSFDNGFVRNSTFTFLTPELTYKDSNFFLSKIDLFKVGLITPYSFFDKSYSWEVSIVEETNPYFLCRDCQSYEVNVGLGLSVGAKEWAPYFLAMTKLRYSTKEVDTFLPIFTPKIGLLMNYETFKWNTSLEAERLNLDDYLSHMRLNSDLSFIYKANYELRFGVEFFQRVENTYENFQSFYSKIRLSFF